LIALTSLGGFAGADAWGENPQERHEYRPAEGQRSAVRRGAEVRQSYRPHATHAESVHAAARRDASQAPGHPVVNNPWEAVGRGSEQRPAGVTYMRETQFARSGRVSAVPYGRAAGQTHVVRYGNALSGTVEHTIRPGLTSRTFVSGGHVLYTHVYEGHVWHQFGRVFAYETFVPAVRYPATFYAWALAPWPRPVTYTWGWQVQPWYPVYGTLFTPYPVYTSPDLWMTDYIIAQRMQTAYQAQTAAPAAPVTQPSDYTPAPQPNDAMPEPQPAAAPSVAPPPAITPQVKAQLDAQIKVQLQEQQAAAATPVALATPGTPPALRPNHVFYQVVQPLEVPSGTADRNCTLSPDDYIKRTGGMSDDDWKIPVVVELSGPSDCPQGLQTRIGLNDLNAMENEQEAQVMQAMQAASGSMGPNGPPSGPGAHPTLIAAGNAAPDPGALEAIRRAQ
jgi:hypothetical protein